MHANTSLLQHANDPSSRFNGLPGLSGNLWPIHPHRLPDELLSSWFVRTAYANGLKLQTFTTLATGDRSIAWNRDIDRYASEAFLQALSSQTGSSLEELRAGMLSAFDGILFEKHNPFGNSKGILPLGIYHRTRKKHGLQFCPLCLFGDETPYFRRAWRLSLNTLCDKHGVMLRDRCPQCESPVIFFRNDLGRRRDYRIGDMVSCWKCDFDLSRSPAYAPSGPDGKSVMALRSIATFHDLGWWFQGVNNIPFSHLYFVVLQHLASFLPTRPGMRMLMNVQANTHWRHTLTPANSRVPFDSRPVGERHQLLTAALWLLDSWPHRFIGAAKSAKLSQSRILRGIEHPHWFESEIKLNLGSGFPAPTREEAHHAAEYLKRQGARVSGVALGRLMGSRDSKALDAYRDRPIQRFSASECERRIQEIDVRIAAQKKNGVRLLAIKRNRTIFQLLKITGWGLRRILDMTLDEVTQRCEANNSEDLDCERHKAFADVLTAYLHDVRPAMATEYSGKALFLTEVGTRLRGKGLY